MALFDCTCDAQSGSARALTFTTAHGDFHTPMFMPVGTSATVKGITPPQLRELKSQVVLANTYHLSQRPGEDVVAEAGGVHKFMNYDGPMLTDSGGFQIFSLADTRKLDDDGVTFRSIYDGSYVRWTPEENMRIQEALGADIPAPFPRMTWDEAMSRYGVDKPDTRFGLELQDVTSIVSNSGFKLFASAKLVKAMRVPGGESLTRKEIDELTEFVKIYGAQGLAWIKIRENEWQSPIAKFLSDEERAGLTEALGLSVGDIVFFQAGEPGMVNAASGSPFQRAEPAA